MVWGNFYIWFILVWEKITKIVEFTQKGDILTLVSYYYFYFLPFFAFFMVKKRQIYEGTTTYGTHKVQQNK